MAKAVQAATDQSVKTAFVDQGYTGEKSAPGLTADDARLGADAVRYSFIVVDLHHLLLAGLPAHFYTLKLCHFL